MTSMTGEEQKRNEYHTASEERFQMEQKLIAISQQEREQAMIRDLEYRKTITILTEKLEKQEKEKEEFRITIDKLMETIIQLKQDNQNTDNFLQLLKIDLNKRMDISEEKFASQLASVWSSINANRNHGEIIQFQQKKELQHIKDYMKESEFKARVLNKVSAVSENIPMRVITKPDGQQRVPILSPPQTPRDDVDRTRVLFCGGSNNNSCGTNEIYLMNKERSSWYQVSLELPYKTYRHGSIFLNGELYIFGGYDHPTYFNSLYKLDKNMKWIELSNMNEKRYGITNSSVELDGCIWVMGGYNGQNLKSVEKYDPNKNSWSIMPNLLYARRNGAAAVIRSRIFICGGTHSVEFFDSSTNIWSEFCTLPSLRSGLAVVSDFNHLIIIGGDDGSDSQLMSKRNVGDIFGEWTDMPPMKTARRLFSVSRFGNEFIAIGGRCPQSQQSVEIYDGEKWEYGPKLPIIRTGLCIVTITEEFAKSLDNLNNFK